MAGVSGIIRSCLDRNRIKPAVAALIVLLSITFLVSRPVMAAKMYVRNGSFQARGGTKKEETVKKYREAGLTCPDAKEWPDWWGCYYGKGAAFEFPRTGGVNADGFARITGKNTFLTGYHGLALEDCNYIYTVWARGKGSLILHVISYGKDEAGKTIQLVKPGEAAAGTEVKVASEKWVRYRHVLVKSPKLWNVHPWISASEGTLDIDEVNIEPSNPALDLIVQEEEKLYGTGALIENLEVAQADDVFLKKQQEYQSALKDFRAASGKLDKRLVDAMEKETAALEPYVLTKGLTTVQVPYYNEMIALARVLERLSGKEPEGAAPVKASEAKVTSAEGYEVGVRKPRPDTVTITEVKPNLRIYAENDEASFKAKIVNSSKSEAKGTLIALLHLDLDTRREIAREEITIAGGQTLTWTGDFNVGAETYGRGIEVRFEDESGKLIDTWQEFFQVAGEWFRVQMHTGGRYGNMSHFFASEPTDFGVHTTDAEVYLSGQAGYRISPSARAAHVIRHYKRLRGTHFTFYQNTSFCGIMGYEEMRKHPQYVLYDENGQFAVDPVYGGYPNPMELASPIEIGPKRKPAKPYLDRQYTPWQHCPSNFADLEVVEYGTKLMRKFASENNLDGVFLDALLVASKGYDYEGKPTLPSDKKEIARLNAQVADTYQRILKEEDPLFGTWFNFSRPGIDHMRRVYDAEALLGSGVDVGGVDVSDEWIRAITGWKNISFLMELQHTFRGGDGFDRHPAQFMDVLLGNRDYIVQKYGGTAIIGYVGVPNDEKEPGPSKWGWPTLNYFGAILTATQHHLVSWARPSYEPEFQFKTRYSRFFWARDIKAVPVEEVEKMLSLSSPEEIWWKRLVYKRETDGGCDVIVHLVRIPPTERWDINWADEPAPLEGVKMSARLGSARLQTAQSMRPYHFEEPQQPVHNVLEAKVEDGKATVEIPPFRYHMMVVFRVKD